MLIRAVLGLEVDEFRTYSELISENNHANLNFSGLVLNETLWQKMNDPVGFRVFAPGYLWKPYEGEVYKPLVASSALRDKRERIVCYPSLKSQAMSDDKPSGFTVA